MSGWDDLAIGAPQPSQPSASGRWQDRLQPFTLPNGSQTVQRPDGAVYIKEANDPRFKGQEGWHAFDPKTGVWAPATPEDASAYGPLARRGLGIEGVKSWLRNMSAGLQRPGEAVAGLGADAANAAGLLDDKVYLGFIKTLEDRERYRQALKNTSGTGAGFTQFTGEALPAAALTALAPEAAPTVFADSAAMAPTTATFGQKAAANALAGYGAAYLTTPGTQSERLSAGQGAALATPVVQGAGKAIPWLATKAGSTLRAFRNPELIPDPTNLNQELLGRVAGEPADVFKGDLLARQAAGKKATGQAYQAVQDLGGQEPLSFQNLGEAVKVAQAEIKGSALKHENAGIRTLADDIQNGLQGSDMDKSFLGAHRLRSHLGELAAMARDENNGALARTYESLRAALTKDMDAYAAKDPSGKLGDAYRLANETFQKEVVPFFANPEIRRQIRAPFPDEQVNRLVKAGPDRVGSVVSMLNKDGKAAFQAHLSDSAMKEAMDVNGDFIPGRFVKAMKDREDAYNLTFRGQDKWQMDGFIKIMKASKLVGDLLPIGKLSHAMDTSVLAQKLFMTEPGRNLLLSASELTPGSKVFESLLTDRLPAVLAVPPSPVAIPKLQSQKQSTSGGPAGWDLLAAHQEQ